MDKTCLVCKIGISESDVFLLNAKAVHNECIERLKSMNTDEDESLTNTHKEVNALASDFKELNSLASRLRRVFDSDLNSRFLQTQQALAKSREILKSLEAKKSKVLSTRAELLARIYDYWPERPPDWDRRRLKMLSSQRYCSICQDSNKGLYIHHKQEISKGGDHTEQNLIVLCPRCHSSKHGGRDVFSGPRSEDSESAFSIKYKILREAADRGGSVSFNYRKFEGMRSERTIYPSSFEKIGTSLCVKGHCTLRSDTRVFAIRRITNLKVES
jgi:hypothetical protein